MTPAPGGGLPSVSVIIPAYQAEAYLGESLESVLAQEHPADEVVVVDDGSTDGTAAVARSFGARVTLVTRETNGGEAAARNTGVAVASADAISMHDADDRMVPQRLRRELEVLVAATDSGRDVGCVLGQQRPFTEDDSPLPPWVLGPDGTPIAYGASNVMAWRSTYDRVGPYDAAFANGTDSDWLIRVRSAGLEVVLLEEVVIERRVHATNMSVTAWAEGEARRPFARSLRQVIEARRAGPSATDTPDEASS